MKQKSYNNWVRSAQDIFNVSPVIPVLVINDIDQAVPLAQALVAGGMKLLEVTLRTECALAAIEQITQAVPQAVVGAGTVLNKTMLQQATAAGAQFAISPGITVELLEAANQGDIPLIPGVMSISEVMLGLEYGFDHFKFFPAEAAGGINVLTAFNAPLPQVRFCPTGGINAANFNDYLALKNVDCIGGSWLTPANAVAKGDWQQITQLCQSAFSKQIN